MQTKFQRNYSLSVQGNDGNTHVISYPLTLEFQIKRDSLYSINSSTFRIYNLGQPTRNLIYLDQFNQGLVFRSLKLLAGYGTTLSTVFNGNVKFAQSYREEKGVNFITEIEGFDFGWAAVNAQSNFNLSPGVDAPVIDSPLVINRLIKDLQATVPKGSNLSIGAISNQFNKGGNAYQTWDRGFMVANPTWPKIQEITQNNSYIDNGKVYVLFEDDVFDGELTVIDSSTGILGTPKKSNQRIDVETLFEPRLQIGQQIQLKSASLSQFNGNYKVIGLEHRGIISGAVGGELKTIISLLLKINTNLINNG